MRSAAYMLLAAVAIVALPAVAQVPDVPTTVDRPAVIGEVPTLRHAGAIPVELRQDERGHWTLYRGGEPYYIRGIGGQVHLDIAVAYGANSVRTWGVDEAVAILDEAHDREMTVLFGLWMGQERQGFDYSDGRSVHAQLEQFREVVRTYKDHPAILMWGVGNEVDLFYEDFRVWNALNDIVEMIKEEDPHHPVTTVTAGLDVAEVQLIMERAPGLDVFGINTYGELVGGTREFRAWGYEGPAVGVMLRRAGWDRPYIIAEWGPDGHWEVPQTAWGAAIEQTSGEKADVYRLRYERGIAADTTHSIGSYVFLWGQKQETTPTWYSLFTEAGRPTEVLDQLHRVWTGEYPAQRAPRMESLTANGQTPFDDVYVDPRAGVTFEATVIAPAGDAVRYEWELMPESTDIGAGGDAETRPPSLPLSIVSQEEGRITVRVPRREGPYRMFVYAHGASGKVATANFPFFVGRPTP